MTATTIAALATSVAILLTALVAFSKRRPEMTQVLVTSASEVVIMQREALSESNARIQALERRSDEQERLAREASDKVEELHLELATMHEGMASLTESRDQTREELDESRHEVERLESRVLLLEDLLKDRGIPVPNGEAS